MTTEIRVPLANQYEIRSGWIDHDDPDALEAGDYLKVLDPSGHEVFYCDSADLLADPIKGRAMLCSFLQACTGLDVAQSQSGPQQDGLTPPA